MLLGVAFLVVPFFTGTTNNTNLLIGLVLVIEGFLGHIYVNNMKKGTLASTLFWIIILLVIPFTLFFLSKKLAYTEEDMAAYN